MTRFQVFAFLATAAMASACGGDALTTLRTPSDGTGNPAAPSLPRPIGLAILPESTTMALGSSLSLAAFLVLSDGSRLPSSAQWMAGDSQIAALNSASGVVTAIRPGQTTIRAQANGFVAVANVVVVEPKAIGSSGALIVERLELTKFEYASASGSWYAPQVRVRAAPGRKLTILSLLVTLPGLGQAPAIACGGVIGETSRELNGEVYGDWTFSVGTPGARAMGDSASVVINFVDDAGTMSKLALVGPIIQGDLPVSYTGGQNGGPCFHGYGATG